MSIMPRPAELMRQHELAALRDERDAALAENERLRDLYENVVGNREQFGWTINHLLECEEALRMTQAECGRYREALKDIIVHRHDVPAQGPLVEIAERALDV